jgi:hypothetical protein
MVCGWRPSKAGSVMLCCSGLRVEVIGELYVREECRSWCKVVG